MRRASGGQIGLHHGAGGPAMRALVAEVFLPGLAEVPVDGFGLASLDDGAAVRCGDRWLVLTTDTHVVQPWVFPGGDIGRLAVAGTVNDLAVMGATERPLLTCAVVLEEGFPVADLQAIQRSLAATCRECGAVVVTGDTKVMPRGEIDGIVINTAGVALTDRVVPDRGLAPGDRILVSGTIGDHGMAVLVARHGLGLEGDLRSDVAPLNGLVREALAAGGEGVVAMKDPTRGGVLAALAEMAAKSGVGVALDEAALPLRDSVRAAAELLGIDPLHVANEGKVLFGVRAGAAGAVLAALRRHPLGREAAAIGVCTGERAGTVVLDTGFGRRLMPEPEGEPMPRIC